MYSDEAFIVAIIFDINIHKYIYFIARLLSIQHVALFSYSPRAHCWLPILFDSEHRIVYFIGEEFID